MVAAWGRISWYRQLVRVRQSWREATTPSNTDGGQISDLLMFAPSLIQFGALTAFAQNYVLGVMQCIGPSMLPTLGISGDVVLMWPTASGLLRPQIGDVVICASPTDPTSTVCKRIVGLPGDVVRYRRLPGMPSSPFMATSDAYVESGRGANEVVLQLPRGQCWLQGDNMADSCDSRYYGPVPLSLVRGIVFLKVWPFFEARWISKTQPLDAGRPLNKTQPLDTVQPLDDTHASRHSHVRVPQAPPLLIEHHADASPRAEAGEVVRLEQPEAVPTADDPKVVAAYRAALLRPPDAEA